MKKYLYPIILFTLLGCEDTRTIDKHFMLSTFDTSEFWLIYLSDDNIMFSIIDKKIAAFRKCGTTIFIVQYPMDSMGRPDDHDPQYFIVDSTVDYSDERVKPRSVDKSRFDNLLKASCEDQSLTYL